jgi:hypothetical protein
MIVPVNEVVPVPMLAFEKRMQKEAKYQFL